MPPRNANQSPSSGTPKTFVLGDDEGDTLDTGLPGGTTDTETLRASAALGASAHGAPVGMPQTVRIILEETDNMPPTGQTFSLNGRAYLIRPGVEVRIPLGVLEVIDNAVESRPIHDPQSLKVVGYRDRQRFPYRIVGPRAA